MTSCDKNFATTDRNTTIFVVKRQRLGKQTLKNHKVIEPIFMSAEHGDGLVDLLRAIEVEIPPEKHDEFKERKQKRMDRFLEYKSMIIDEIVELKRQEIEELVDDDSAEF